VVVAAAAALVLIQVLELTQLRQLYPRHRAYQMAVV
jgi:hypothetical protein